MIVGPKTHKTSAVQRDIICVALDLYVNAKRRRISQIDFSLSGGIDRPHHARLRREREDADMKLAHALDLLKEFES